MRRSAGLSVSTLVVLGLVTASAPSAVFSQNELVNQRAADLVAANAGRFDKIGTNWMHLRLPIIATTLFDSPALPLSRSAALRAAIAECRSRAPSSPRPLPQSSIPCRSQAQARAPRRLRRCPRQAHSADPRQSEIPMFSP